MSFLDVFANTIGGLAFLLILAIMMVGGLLVGQPPIITTEALPDGYHEREYLVWLGAREGLGKFQWAFGEGAAPRGLKLEESTGKLSGMIALAAADADPSRFEFAVNCELKTEEGVKRDQRKFALTVHRAAPIKATPLRILTEPALPPAYREKPYPLVFAAEGGQAPYTWSWAGAAPDGLNLNSHGQLEGRPRSIGKFNFSASVVTASGERQSKEFELTISENYPPPPPLPPLKVLTERVPAAVAEKDYAVQIAAHGGAPPYKWTLAEGGPRWLQANAEASAFAGQPALADVGEHRIVWQVTDSRNDSARSDALKLEVLPPSEKPPPPLRLKTTALPDARLGQPYSLAIAVAGGFSPYQWNAGQLAPELGLSLAPNEGLLSGNPTSAGRFPVPITVTDRAGGQTSAELLLGSG